VKKKGVKQRVSECSSCTDKYQNRVTGKLHIRIPNAEEIGMFLLTAQISKLERSDERRVLFCPPFKVQSFGFYIHVINIESVYFGLAEELQQGKR